MLGPAPATVVVAMRCERVAGSIDERRRPGAAVRPRPGADDARSAARARDVEQVAVPAQHARAEELRVVELAREHGARRDRGAWRSGSGRELADLAGARRRRASRSRAARTAQPGSETGNTTVATATGVTVSASRSLSAREAERERLGHGGSRVALLRFNRHGARRRSGSPSTGSESFARSRAARRARACGHPARAASRSGSRRSASTWRPRAAGRSRPSSDARPRSARVRHGRRARAGPRVNSRPSVPAAATTRRPTA